jgi:hypothetical protein
MFWQDAMLVDYRLLVWMGDSPAPSFVCLVSNTREQRFCCGANQNTKWGGGKNGLVVKAVSAST